MNDTKIYDFPAHHVTHQGLPLPPKIRKGTLLRVRQAALQDLGHDIPGRDMRSDQALATGMTLPQGVSTLRRSQLIIVDPEEMKGMRRQNMDP